MAKSNDKVQQLNQQDKELWTMRHSAEHVLMHAMRDLGYDFVMAMGPATDEGFYFDFEITSDQVITEEDFDKIEKKMRGIIARDLPMTREEVSVEEAKELFGHNPYKMEWINEAAEKGEEISIYWTGEKGTPEVFVDLCAGPHVESTGKIGAVKLLSTAGAYWRGDEHNIMLTRIYGTAYHTQEELEAYVEMMEEAKKRDHRKLGQQLKLFMFHETSPGAPYWLPDGLQLINTLVEYWRQDHRARGYKEVATPLINKKELWETSGHWDHYKDDMFIADMGENEVYGLKPMNCPNAMVIFGSDIRSYRELPLRLSDTDQLHRYERAGTLHGLLRVRSFRQDDAHIFLTQDQIKDEYHQLFEICDHYYNLFGLSYKFRLGTRPDDFLGDIETWNRAEGILHDLLTERVGKDGYYVEEGDGAFYGPKVDIVMFDSLGREWQMGTIQLDFQLPQRFNLKYTAADGTEQMPVVIHRVIYGSLERFMGILIEHFAGAFPVWMHPTQVEVLPLNDEMQEYASKVMQQISEQMPNVRIEVDASAETLQKKIRNAQLKKIPYMLIVGKREEEAQTVSLRLRTGEEIKDVKVEDFVHTVKNLVEQKSLELWS